MSQGRNSFRVTHLLNRASLECCAPSLSRETTSFFELLIALITNDLRSAVSCPSWSSATNRDSPQLPGTRLALYRPALPSLHFTFQRRSFLRHANMLWFTQQAMNETSTAGTGPAEVLFTVGCRAQLVGLVGGWSRGWAGMASRPCPGSSARPSSSPSWLC